MADDFYLRYYVGHKGQYGHEFLEVELRPNGKLRYANDSHYRKETIIRKEAFVSQSVLNELKSIIRASTVMKLSDEKWPMPDKGGKQELEIILDNEHISFHTAKIGSLLDVQQSQDPEGLRDFYYLVQDIKTLFFTLITMHFKINPIG